MSLMCDVLLDDSRWSERLNLETLVNQAVQKAVEVTTPKLHPAAEVSFTFADDARIRELNLEWRDKDAPTNVLSFPASQAADLTKAPLLGDIILAYETIEREAAEEGKPFAHHATHMIVHGFLHLIGYDHMNDAEAAEMENFESEILGRLGIPDPWAGDEDEGKA
jgi:probable rRNA maturation factor